MPTTPKVSPTASSPTLLDELLELRERMAALAAKRETLVEKAMAPVASRLQAIEDRYEKELEPIAEQAAAVEGKIKEVVTKHGVTVRGRNVDGSGMTLAAVYNRPTVRWNTDKLEALAIEHPAILSAKIVAPSGSVQIRTAKPDVQP